MVSGPHRKDLGWASDEIDGFRFHLLAWLPAVHHSNLMLINLCGVVFGFCMALQLHHLLLLLLMNPTRI